MTRSTETATLTLYEEDFYLWLKTTAEQLKKGRFAEVDLDNLIEEIESMGRSERHALKSLLTPLSAAASRILILPRMLLSTAS